MGIENPFKNLKRIMRTTLVAAMSNNFRFQELLLRAKDQRRRAPTRA